VEKADDANAYCYIDGLKDKQTQRYRTTGQRHQDKSKQQKRRESFNKQIGNPPSTSYKKIRPTAPASTQVTLLHHSCKASLPEWHPNMQDSEKKKEKFTLFSDHNRSLLRQQPM